MGLDIVGEVYIVVKPEETDGVYVFVSQDDAREFFALCDGFGENRQGVYMSAERLISRATARSVLKAAAE